MTVFIILLVCVHFDSFTKADDNNDYINGLPSSERKELVERISRRIVEEVEVKGSPEQSEVHVPDAQLEESRNFAIKIIEEVREQFKKSRRNQHKTSQPKTGAEDEEKKTNLTLRANDQDHIDLTVNRKRTAIDPEDQENLSDTKIKREIHVPVQVVFDDPKGTNQSKRSSRDDGDNRRDGDVSAVEKKSEEHKSAEESKAAVDGQISGVTTVKSLETTTSFSPATESDTTSNDGYGSTSTIDDDLLTTTDDSVSETWPPHLQDDNASEINLRNLSNDSSPTTEAVIQSSLEPKTTVRSTQEPLTTVNITQEAVSYETTTPDPETTNGPQSTTAEPLIKTTEDAIIEKFKRIDPEKIATATTESKPTGESTKNILRAGIIFEDDGMAGLSKAYKEQSVETTRVPTELPFHYETLFDALTTPTKDGILEQDREVPSNSHAHGVKSYRVYEVDPAADPFNLRTDDRENRDQPHYAPVYNYEPELAFFNPQHRGGSILKEDDGKDNLRQTASKELRTNVEQEQEAPVYNYEPENAYFNPYNRLGPNEDNLEAGVQVSTAKSFGKFDEEYYFAKNGVIEDSEEGRKFNFRSFAAAAESGKVNKDLNKDPSYATTLEPNDHIQQRVVQDYTDYYYGRKSSKKKDRLRSQKWTPDKFSLDKFLDDYFSKKKKSALARSRQLSGQNVDDNLLRINKKQGSPNPISLDYYYGVNNDAVSHVVEALQHKMLDPKYQDHFLTTQKPVKNGFRHRGIDNNAIAFDYYFDRQEAADHSENDVKDDNDQQNLDRTSQLGRKSSREDEVDTNVRNINTKEANKKALEPYTNVVKYMFEINSGVLVSYDWLATTVSIRSALTKLIDLIDAEEEGEVINAEDKEILNYLVALHEDAVKSVSRSSKKHCFDLKLPDVLINGLRRSILPKNKRMKPGERIKNPLKLMRDAYVHLMRTCLDAAAGSDVKRSPTRYQDFRKFLEDLQDGLYDVSIHWRQREKRPMEAVDHHNYLK